MSDIEKAARIYLRSRTIGIWLIWTILGLLALLVLVGCKKRTVHDPDITYNVNATVMVTTGFYRGCFGEVISYFPAHNEYGLWAYCLDGKKWEHWPIADTFPEKVLTSISEEQYRLMRFGEFK